MMTPVLWFAVLAGLLTVLTVGWLVRPLLRRRAGTGVSGARVNAAIYREQLQALERDLASGTLAAADYEVARDEIRLRLLEDVPEVAVPGTAPAGDAGTDGGGASAAPAARGPRRAALALALLVPLCAAGLYAGFGGGRAALDPVAARADGMAEINRMVEGLAARLRAKPDDPKGWAMLARSYKALGRFDDAVEAVQHAGKLLETDADLMVAYADLLALRNDRRIEGEALTLVNRALRVDPNHPTALLMAGVAAYRRGEFRLAVTQLEKVLPQLEAGSPDAQDVASRIADARVKAGMPPSTLAAVAAAPALPATSSAAANPVGPEQINQMVERLAARLAKEPGDLAGWARLARAYKVQKRLDEAAAAYERARKLVDTDPDLLTQYADLLALRNGNSLAGQPAQLVEQALKLDPRHPVALMLAAQAAYQGNDFSRAIGYWERVQKVLDPASSDAAQVRAELAEARSRLAGRK